MDVRRAAGTNLVVGFLLGVAGFAAHAGALGIDWPLLARRARRCDSGRLARRPGDGTLRRAGCCGSALGAVLVVVGAAFAAQAVL